MGRCRGLFRVDWRFVKGCRLSGRDAGGGARRLTGQTGPARACAHLERLHESLEPFLGLILAHTHGSLVRMEHERQPSVRPSDLVRGCIRGDAENLVVRPRARHPRLPNADRRCAEPMRDGAPRKFPSNPKRRRAVVVPVANLTVNQFARSNLFGTEK